MQEKPPAEATVQPPVETVSSTEFEPKVVAFCCTYCAYTAADLAGAMRLTYPPHVRVVQVLCTGKVEADWLLRALEEGADAVYVAGCALGDCHFLEGNRQAIRTVAHVKRLLAEVGLEPERVEFFHIPASAGSLFAQRAEEMTQRARQLGPNPLRAQKGLVESRTCPLPPDPHPPLPPARFGQRIRDETYTNGTHSVEGRD